MVKEIKKIIGARNSLAHAGKYKMDLRVIHNRLVFIRDFLYLFDFHKGFKKVHYFVSGPRRNYLK